MLLELVVILAALGLMYLIWAYWINRPKGEVDASASATDVFNQMSKNDSNPFNLMIDFTQPVDKTGPEGTEDPNVETFKFS